MECPLCKNTKWRTKIKGKSWICRKCGYLKNTDNIKVEMVEPIRYIDSRTPKERKEDSKIKTIVTSTSTKPLTITNISKKLKWWQRLLKK